MYNLSEKILTLHSSPQYKLLKFDATNITNTTNVEFDINSCTGPSNHHTHKETFTFELLTKLTRNNITHASDLMNLLEIMNSEYIEIIHRVMLKKNSYFVRFFSDENWSEWLENKTALGVLITKYINYIDQPQSKQRKIIKGLDKNFLRKTAKEAHVVLQKLAERDSFNIGEDAFSSSSFLNKLTTSVTILIDDYANILLPLPQAVSAIKLDGTNTNLKKHNDADSLVQYNSALSNEFMAPITSEQNIGYLLEDISKLGSGLHDDISQSELRGAVEEKLNELITLTTPRTLEDNINSFTLFLAGIQDINNLIYMLSPKMQHLLIILQRECEEIPTFQKSTLLVAINRLSRRTINQHVSDKEYGSISSWLSILLDTLKELNPSNDQDTIPPTVELILELKRTVDFNYPNKQMMDDIFHNIASNEEYQGTQVQTRAQRYLDHNNFYTNLSSYFINIKVISTLIAAFIGMLIYSSSYRTNVAYGERFLLFGHYHPAFNSGFSIDEDDYAYTHGH